ncbi:hypothetical protein EDB85DRAFT_1457289 [Lactarius pseudohatsudake]|nr:hypothetical protein EDB85DRAFT_1457289 [Lactarius pseudohatsudake]
MLIVQSGLEVYPRHATMARGLSVLWHDWITIYLFVLVETGRLPQDGAIDRLPLWRSMTAFQSTRQLIHRILFATAVPHSAIFLALWYIFRLPISPQTVVYAQDTARARFRDSLKNGSAHLIEGYMMRVFTAGIMLADKWVNDQTFQLRTWHEIPAYPKSSCAISKSRLWAFWNTICEFLGTNGRCGWGTSHLGTRL